MLIDPIQMAGDDAEQRGVLGFGHFSDHDSPRRGRPPCGAAAARGAASRGFRVVRTMYPPTSGHESTASRHAP